MKDASGIYRLVHQDTYICEFETSVSAFDAKIGRTITFSRMKTVQNVKGIFDKKLNDLQLPPLLMTVLAFDIDDIQPCISGDEKSIPISAANRIPFSQIPETFTNVLLVESLQPLKELGFCIMSQTPIYSCQFNPFFNSREGLVIYHKSQCDTLTMSYTSTGALSYDTCSDDEEFSTGSPSDDTDNKKSSGESLYLSVIEMKKKKISGQVYAEALNMASQLAAKYTMKGNTQIKRIVAYCMTTCEENDNNVGSISKMVLDFIKCESTVCETDECYPSKSV